MGPDDVGAVRILPMDVCLPLRLYDSGGRCIMRGRAESFGSTLFVQWSSLCFRVSRVGAALANEVISPA